MNEPRYTEIATFLRAPLARTFADVDIGLIGAPTDLGVTNRPGARHGPRQIRNSSSLMRNFHLALGVNLYELCRIADLGDVRLSHRYDLEQQIEDIETFPRKVHAAGIRPVTAGDDHSITYPIFKAIAADAPIGMVHIDAHTDTWGEFFGSKFTHGAPFRLAVEEGLLDPKRTIQIGIRGGQNYWLASSSLYRAGCESYISKNSRRSASSVSYKKLAVWWATAPPTSPSTWTGSIPCMHPAPAPLKLAV